MGYVVGQGLGKKEDGIQNPIEVTENVNRLGLDLGHGNMKILRDKITQRLEDYILKGCSHNLVFSNEFSNEERRIIHGYVTLFYLIDILLFFNKFLESRRSCN